MSLVAKQAEFLINMTQLLAKAYKMNLIVTGGELYRTPEQQRIYIEQGRSKTMRSKHLQRCAIDLNLFTKDKKGKLHLTYDKAVLQPLGDFWEGLHANNRWGGNWKSFKDTPHFERLP